jgi:hypothetical protein
MTKFFLIVFIAVLSLAYGQIAGVLPTSNAEAEADWISIGLILFLFLFLFVIFKHSTRVNDDMSQSRCRDEVLHEISERDNHQD